MSKAADILIEMPTVSSTVVTPVASSSFTAAATTNELPSDGALKTSAGQLPTVETIDGLILGLLTSDTSKTATNELPNSSTSKKTSAGKMSFADIVTGLTTELISRGDTERSADGIRLRDPLYELIMKLICTDTPRPSMDGSPHKDPIYGLIMELVSIETQKQSKGKSASTSTLYKLLMELLSIDAIKPPAPTLPSGNILKRTFRMLSRDTRSRLGQSSVSMHSLPQGSSTMQPILNSGLEATAMPDSPPTMTSITTQELTELGSLPDPHQPQLLSRSSKSKSIFKFRFRLGRRDTTFVSNTGLDEPRDSTNTVGSGSNSNRSFIGSAVDAIKLWLKTNTSKKSNTVRTALLPATPLASVV